MRHAVYMPTNRPSVRCIADAATDAAAVASVVAELPTLVVVEHLDGPWVADHRAGLARAKREHGLPVIHLTLARARALVGAVLERLPDTAPRKWLSEALIPLGTAYGAGPNKMALLAAALEIDALHRRDSDVLLDRRGDSPVLPGVLEAQAIGRPAEPATDRAGAPGAPVRIVASSYFGDPPLDRRDLFRAGWRFARAAEDLLGSADTEAGLDAAITRYFLVEPATRFGSDFFEEDPTGRSDMGVCCTLGLHEQLPEMPAISTLGCDYMQRNLASQLGMPVLWHSRKVEHRYGTDRTAGDRREYAVSYAMSEARLVLLWSAWREHNASVAASPADFGDPLGNVDQAAYAASFRRGLETARGGFGGLVARYTRLHREASVVAPRAEGDRLKAVADGLEHGANQLCDSVSRSITDYARLVELWPQIIEAAKFLRDEDHLWS